MDDDLANLGRDACIPGSIDRLKLGGIIFDASYDLGVSKAHLADYIDVSISTIDQWEIGGASPLLRKLAKVFDLLDLDPRETMSAVSCERATRCVLAALGIEQPPGGEDWPKWEKQQWLSFAQDIKSRREAIKASRRLVSCAAGLNMGTLTAIERGLFKAGAKRAVKLAWLFEVGVDDQAEEPQAKKG